MKGLDRNGYLDNLLEVRIVKVTTCCIESRMLGS